MARSRALLRMTLLCAGLLGCAVPPPSRIAAPVDHSPPPPLHAERIPPPPRHKAERLVWEPGHYLWDGDGYSWTPGHYVRKPAAHARFVHGRWEQSAGSWVWVPGHWS